jgi:hypothetical protein
MKRHCCFLVSTKCLFFLKISISKIRKYVISFQKIAFLVFCSDKIKKYYIKRYRRYLFNGLAKCLSGLCTFFKNRQRFFFGNLTAEVLSCI